MSLLGEYLNTYQRANPAEGLMRGFQTGSQFMFAAQQQKMQQEQLAQQKAQQEKQDDLRQLTVLLEAYGKVKSKTGKTQIGQRFAQLYSKLNPDSPMSGSDFVHTETADNFMTKARGLKKLLTENPELGIKEIDNLLTEAAQEESEGNIERQEYQDLEKSVAGIKKEAAGELGGLATYPEQFRSEPAYQTPEAKAGIEGYQNKLISQMTSLGSDEGMKIQRGLQQERAAGEYKPPQPWGFVSAPDGTQKAVGFDPSSKKVVTYDMPYSGQVTPFSLGRTPAAEVKSGTALDTLKGNIERIKTDFDPKYVGFVTGRTRQLQASTVGGLPEKQTAFYADVNDLSDMLLRARSGAQINEQEYQRLTKLVPTPNLPPSTFRARLKRFELQLNQTLANQQRRLKQGGYIAPAIQETSQQPKSKTWAELKKVKGY